MDILNYSISIKKFLEEQPIIFNKKILYNYNLYKCPKTDNFFLKIDYFSTDIIEFTLKEKINNFLLNNIKEKVRLNKTKDIIIYNRSYKDDTNIKPSCDVYLDCFSTGKEYFYENLQYKIVEKIFKIIIICVVYMTGITLMNFIYAFGYYLITEVLGFKLLQRSVNILNEYITSIYKYILKFLDNSEFIVKVKKFIESFRKGCEDCFYYIGTLNVIYLKENHFYREAREIYDTNNFKFTYDRIINKMEEINYKYKELIDENSIFEKIIYDNLLDDLIIFINKKLKNLPILRNNLQRNTKELNKQNFEGIVKTKSLSFTKDFPIYCTGSKTETKIQIDFIANQSLNLYFLLERSFDNLSSSKNIIKKDKKTLSFTLNHNESLLTQSYIYIESLNSNKIVLNNYLTDEPRQMKTKDFFLKFEANSNLKEDESKSFFSNFSQKLKRRKDDMKKLIRQKLNITQDMKKLIGQNLKKKKEDIDKLKIPNLSNAAKFVGTNSANYIQSNIFLNPNQSKKEMFKTQRQLSKMYDYIKPEPTTTTNDYPTESRAKDNPQWVQKNQEQTTKKIEEKKQTKQIKIEQQKQAKQSQLELLKQNQEKSKDKNSKYNQKKVNTNEIQNLFKQLENINKYLTDSIYNESKQDREEKVKDIYNTINKLKNLETKMSKEEKRHYFQLKDEFNYYKKSAQQYYSDEGLKYNTQTQKQKLINNLDDSNFLKLYDKDYIYTPKESQIIKEFLQKNSTKFNRWTFYRKLGNQFFLKNNKIYKKDDQFKFQ